jgi:hypothetical protein
MIASTGLDAQVYRDRRGAPYYGGDYGGDRYGRGSYGNGDPGDVVQRVIRDMDLAARNSYTSRWERDQFNRAISDLMNFQDRWSRRRQVDTGRLDRAVNSMRRLVESRQLDGRSRRMIGQDMEILRDLRAQLSYRRY